VRVVTGADSAAIDRSRVKLVQTPQTFLSSILLPAYAQEYRESFTDEASVVEANGEKVFLINGEADNIKITTPVDLALAEQLFKLRTV
jgi:2-C-methyl-D-erythritol 4-phosphate cytidylyltransferase